LNKTREYNIIDIRKQQPNARTYNTPVYAYTVTVRNTYTQTKD